MGYDAIGDETRNLKIQSLIEGLGDTTVSEEIVFLIDIAEADGEEGQHSENWHRPTKG